MGYHVVRAGEHSFEERPNPTGPPRQGEAEFFDDPEP